MEHFSNSTFAEIEVGTTASHPHRLTRMDIDALAIVSGEIDPFHVSEDGVSRKEVSAAAVAAEAILSAMLKRRFPGPGTTILSQDLAFSGELSVGDEVKATVTVRDKRDPDVIILDCAVVRGDETVVSGLVTVAAPTEHLTYSRFATPQVILRRNDGFAPIFKMCADTPPVTCAVVHPCDRNSLLGAIDAAKAGLITPTLVGPEKKIRAVAEEEGVDLSPYRIVSTEHSVAAAQAAVAMVRTGEIDSLMKGSLHTDELMAAVVPSATGLRTARRISHVFIMDVPAYPHILLVTDAAINIAPTAKEKVDIVQNAIDLAHILGISEPRVAILAAVETVNPLMPATVDAAVLCKMADRGQITGGILDGPLAFDNAVSEEAARIKKITSPVAGKADILLVPDLEAGNILAKQLEYLAGANGAGIVLGARVPIVLTSRADSARNRLTSAAIMKLVANALRAPAGAKQFEVAHV
ncbi:bifunctional enoyl-CoA hydratase/phosphate acetyltransferase [Occallatibacter riparius]|uniref:Bifunctional enoyl-CoA hydratase/phosphate acetyltransferase n=1 Tax=Occallatibacter riparius TaxID=1002689 RepID=A0A9J7BTU7_9BACT|nr:bifunctional enoyl-CoA hydratase/phosphate acetyltransferase [Occallatibacter riparius]UWZ86072.1 bifunctional enoyl-CoA hydratase/phosphate acetyltransferase [Occallatibacter riparius]